MQTIVILSFAIWGGPILLATLAALPAAVSSRYRRMIGEYLVGSPAPRLTLDGPSDIEAERN